MFRTMGDRGGSSRPGCKWHLGLQGEGVCALCLRTSLAKLAAYQGGYQESLDTYTGALLSTSVAEFSREREISAQSFHPTYPSVSYRSRSKKERKPKGGVISQDRRLYDSRKSLDATNSKARTTWGVAFHRIASLRSALTSLWKLDKQPDEKSRRNTEVRDTHHCYPCGQYAAEEVREERFCGQQHAAGSETRLGYGDSKCHLTSSIKTTPLTGPSSFVSKFTHRSNTPEGFQTRWRSRSSREASREPHICVSTDYGPQTPDDNQVCGAPSQIQTVPHPNSKSSPWSFFSRSGSRRSPHNGLKVETLKPTPMGFTTSSGSQYPLTTSDCRSSPLSRGFSPKLSPGDCISKSARSSPSKVKPDSASHVSLASKSTSRSRTLSPSNKTSPLYLAPSTMDIKRDSLSRDSLHAQESLDLSNPIYVQGHRGTRLFTDGVQDTTSRPSRDECTPFRPSNHFREVTFIAQQDRLVINHVSDTQRRLAPSHACTGIEGHLVQTSKDPARGDLKLGSLALRHLFK